MKVDFVYTGEFLLHSQFGDFTLEVLIENVGQIASGPYSLKIRGRIDGTQDYPWNYPPEVFLPGLAPGETYKFVRDNFALSWVGGMELLIEIFPTDQNDPIDNNVEWEHVWLVAP